MRTEVIEKPDEPSAPVHSHHQKIVIETEVKEEDLVSIITPSYNCSRFVAETIESVQAQTYQNWEMIIVDDCSTDNSVEIIKKIIKGDSRIRLIEQKWNGGPAVARNVAIENAGGRYIAFLDSDDLWFPEKLEKQIEFIQEKKADLVYSAYKKMNEDGTDRDSVNPPSEVDYKDLLKSNHIGCLTALYDTKNIEKCYMPIISKRQDHALWLKILKKTEKAYCFNGELAKYRVLNNSVSSNKVVAAKYQWRIYREVEKLGFFESVRNFIFYSVYGFLKYKK